MKIDEWKFVLSRWSKINFSNFDIIENVMYALKLAQYNCKIVWIRREWRWTTSSNDELWLSLLTYFSFTAQFRAARAFDRGERKRARNRKSGLECTRLLSKWNLSETYNLISFHTTEWLKRRERQLSTVASGRPNPLSPPFLIFVKFNDHKSSRLKP